MVLGKVLIKYDVLMDKGNGNKVLSNKEIQFITNS